QLVRAAGLQPAGHRFESDSAHWPAVVSILRLHCADAAEEALSLLRVRCHLVEAPSHWTQPAVVQRVLRNIWRQITQDRLVEGRSIRAMGFTGLPPSSGAGAGLNARSS